jgi:glycosyltransferase involved in cell wall biosynthesis
LKKVKVFIDVYYYKAALSGIRTYITELKSASEKYGSENIEYIFSHDIDKLSNNEFYLNSKNQLIRWLFQLNYLVWKQVFLPIKLLKLKPDYLICPDYVAPIFSFKTKRITVIHDSLFWDYPNNYSSIWRKYFISLINLGIDNKTQIITTSNYSKKSLIKIIKKTTLIDYIYQSFENIFGYKSNLTNKIKLPELYILHIGSFEKRKDLITLVKAFHVIKKQVSNKKIKLVLAGAQIVNGNKKVIKQIKSYILNNDLENEILLPNYITKEEAHQYYKNALLYVFPSVDEGFGIPIIEAFSYSLPIICSDIPVFREIANESVSYFNKGNFISLSEKIQTLIDSKDLREELIKKGNNQLNKFSRKNFIEGFENIIINWNEK